MLFKSDVINGMDATLWNRVPEEPVTKQKIVPFNQPLDQGWDVVCPDVSH